MATQQGTIVVDLIARTKKFGAGIAAGTKRVKTFVSESSKGFRKVGKRFAGLAKRFLGLSTLIASAAGAFSFVSLIKGSIEAASAVDQFNIRLQNLIGSQQEAADVIKNLGTLARKIAPSLRDLIESAATLGTVALGNGRKILTLTETAANIQAVTGLTLTQSAQNLQRALSAGIGAADLFRERGVRAILEALGDVPNLIDAPLSEVEKAFEKVFGPQGVFKDAAAAFAVTLPGAISRAGDAFFNFQSAIGEALTPTIVAVLTEVIIPSLEKFTKA